MVRRVVLLLGLAATGCGPGVAGGESGGTALTARGGSSGAAFRTRLEEQDVIIARLEARLTAMERELTEQVNATPLEPVSAKAP